MSLLAIALGYRRTMASILPMWQDLENRIQLSEQNMKTYGTLHGKGIAFLDWHVADRTDLWIGLVVLILFYIAKTTIVRCRIPIDIRVLLYSGLVCAVLPILYLRLTEWGNGLIYFSGNWIFMPIATLTIPTITFVYDLRSEKPRSVMYIAIRSIAEIFLLLPVWFYLSIFLLLMFGFAWI
jgi:hypothetical protein